MFQPANSRVNFPQLEEKILDFWKTNNIFKRSIENRRGGPRFTLYEGPPTANGSPGIHHVISRVLKDIIPRYKAMKGFYTPRIGGWDTHGLPVELEIEKELGFSGKAQIEEYGIGRFNELCRQSARRYIKEFEDMTERIAFWVDLENAYVTMDNSYIETVWWALKQMWDKGLIYQGYRVTPHCPRCETSLSSHEVALGYQDDVEDPSVYIKFKVAELPLIPKNEENDDKITEVVSPFKYAARRPSYFLAWTTTPWTLPGNTALAVAPDADYALVEIGDEYLILADALRVQVGLGDNRVVEKVKGRYLVGAEYEPLFNPHEFGVERRRFQAVYEYGVGARWGLQLQEPNKYLAYKVVEGDFVSLEEGTGIVHMAPAYGEVDFDAGEYHGLDFVHPVDLQGRIIGNYLLESGKQLSGKFVKDADPLILDDLESRNLLFRSETIRHTYPFCWRCEAPLLYYAKQTWYIRTTALKDNLIAGNQQINWYPEHIKYGRFGDWLENNIDWAFSRERYWGTPLPVWQCPSCGNFDCVGGVQDLKNKPGVSGLEEPLDLHRPFVDGVTFTCSQCGGQMQRVSEVIDCWFDSGAMPIAQSHYPFENDTLLEDGRFPADFICEAIDQTRGWFYSLHAISTLLFDHPSFKNVISHGHILDAKGEKMSKSKGNVVDLWSVIGKYGADALRWYLFTAVPMGNSMRFDESDIAERTRQFLLKLWNVYSFFVTYARIDNFVPTTETTPAEQSELDRWITSELNQLILDVDTALDNYDPRAGAWQIAAFVDNLSNWYVRRSRRRFWKSENDADKLSAYNTLYQCLVTVARLLAPFTPFLAEELHQNLVRTVFADAPDSVHLTDFPVTETGSINRQLMDDTQLAMKVSSLGRAARSQAGIKVRQPLAEVVVKVSSKQDREGLQRLMPQVLEELNVKDIKFADPPDELDKPGLSVTTEGNVTVAVPTEISPQLQAEGMAREIVHRLQTMRRSARFDIADHITTCYQGDSYVNQVMQDFADYIKQETLSTQLVESPSGQDAFSESYKLSGHEITLGVKKLG